MAEFARIEANVLGKSAATGVAFALTDRFVFQDSKAFDMNLLNKSLTSAGSEFASATVVDPLTQQVLGGAGGDALQVITGPALSGAVYAFASGMLNFDSRPFQTKMLHQAGASLIGSQLEKPIAGLLGQ